MKKSDLKIPFSWEDRKPYLLDRLLFLPEHYQYNEEKKLLFSIKEIFENERPVVVEYCSGNGQWIIEKARNNPEYNWIAIEKRFDRARKIWVKMHNQKLDNLFVVMGEALTFSKYYLSDDNILLAYINFPDPWPKNKHAKHRIVQKDFILELFRILYDKGKVIIATDDKESCYRMMDCFLSIPLWLSSFDFPYYVNQWPNYGYSFFEDLWKKKGKKIYYLQFEKKSG